MLMMGSLKDVDYGDVAGVLPVVLMLVFMMVTSSVGNGIGIGLITYSVLKICTGQGQGSLLADHRAGRAVHPQVLHRVLKRI